MPQQITTHADEERALELATKAVSGAFGGPGDWEFCIPRVASAILRSKAEVLREFCVHFSPDPEAFKYINEMLIQAGRLEEAADRMEKSV